ncbi:MAG: phosphatidate cytidylyltransferase [Actinomycetota bacterium]
MSDDMWRRADEDDESDDFGELRFADDDVSAEQSESDVDVWASYSGTAPRPIPDRPAAEPSGRGLFEGETWRDKGRPIDLTPVSESGRLGRVEPPVRPDASFSDDEEFGEIRFADAHEESAVDFGFEDEPVAPRIEPGHDTSGSRPRIKLGEPTTPGRRERGSGALRRPPDAPTSVPSRSMFDDPQSEPIDFGSESTWDLSRGTGRDPSRSPSRETARDLPRDPSGPLESRRGPDQRRGPRPPDEASGLSGPVGRPSSGGRPRPSTGRSGPPRPARVARPQQPVSGAAGRDMPTAIAVGLLIAAAFIGALMWRPVAVLALVVLICGLAAIEFFEKVTEKGYRPATVIGILTAVVAPLAGYWVGETALPLVMVFGFVATGATFVGATGLHSSPIPNMSVTSLGMMWIGLMGAYAAMLAGVSNVPGLGTAGTDTLFIVAVGVVANDVGALFVGSAAGSTPLRQWISPNKTVEGLMGGTVATLFAMWVVGLQSDTWNDIGEIVTLAIAVAVLAPLGDLVESMFKRNLEIKDFGTLIKGHGGVLDRFDGFLFVLPAAYYLLQVFEPYAS